jgi:hypothetical protein
MTRGAKHDSIHAGGLLHYVAGEEAISDMFAVDIRVTHYLRSSKRAADLSIVTRRLLTEHLGDVDALPSLDPDGTPRFLAHQTLLHDSLLAKKPFDRFITLLKD